MVRPKLLMKSNVSGEVTPSASISLMPTLIGVGGGGSPALMVIPGSNVSPKATAETANRRLLPRTSPLRNDIFYVPFPRLKRSPGINYSSSAFLFCIQQIPSRTTSTSYIIISRTAPVWRALGRSAWPAGRIQGWPEDLSAPDRPWLPPGNIRFRGPVSGWPELPGSFLPGCKPLLLHTLASCFSCRWLAPGRSDPALALYRPSLRRRSQGFLAHRRFADPLQCSCKRG